MRSFLPRVTLRQRVALLDDARVHAHERQRAELVVDDLERERARRRFVFDFLHADDLTVRIDHADAAVLAGEGQVVDDAVEQLLHAFVLERRAAEDRHELAGDGALADALLEHRGVELAGLDEFHERVFVQPERLLEQFLAQLRNPIDPLVVRRGRELEPILERLERHRLPRAVLVVGLPDVAHAGDEVRHAGELVVTADRHVTYDGLRVQPFFDAFHAVREVRAHAVHLVDVAHARHVVLVREPPVRFRLRLHAGHAVEYDNRAVEHAQTAVHFDREVDVPRSIDQVDLVTLPLGGDGRALNRDAALALLLEVVGGRAGLAVLGVVHLDDLVLLTGVIEHALRGRGLTGIDVGDDADVAIELQGLLPGHSVVRNLKRSLGSAVGRQRVATI